MKKVRLFLLLGIGFLFGSQSLFAASSQDTDKKTQLAQQIKQAVADKKFVVDVDRVIPMSGHSVNVTSTYTLEIKGDTVVAGLPYFGRAYSVPYGGSGGLNFTEVMTGYHQDADKKGNPRIHFHVKTDDDSYEFYMDVFTNGSVTINVTPVNKQSITYYGDVIFPKEKK